MVANFNPGADSNQGESALGRRRRERTLCVGKGGCTPPYIGQGVPSSSPPPCGIKLPRGECAGQGRGDGPHPWRQAQGGKPPPPLMGPIWPIKSFSIF